MTRLPSAERPGPAAEKALEILSRPLDEVLSEDDEGLLGVVGERAQAGVCGYPLSAIKMLITLPYTGSSGP